MAHTATQRHRIKVRKESYAAAAAAACARNLSCTSACTGARQAGRWLRIWHSQVLLLVCARAQGYTQQGAAAKRALVRLRSLYSTARRKGSTAEPRTVEVVPHIEAAWRAAAAVAELCRHKRLQALQRQLPERVQRQVVVGLEQVGL